MTDQTARKKPDGSAWQAHMDAVTARNDATRKAGRQVRQEHERREAIRRQTEEQNQSAELRRWSGKSGGSANLDRTVKGKGSAR